MKVLFILGSRGEWGYIKPIIRKSKEYGIRPLIYAVNASVLVSYGGLVDEIEREGFEVSKKSLTSMEGDTRAAMAKSMGILNLALVDGFESIKPDWIVCAGDRAEQLVAAMVASYLYIPLAHIQAGERSGNIDGVARHAIARFSHLHFAANEDAKERLIRSGEDSWRVFNTGAPQIDDIRTLEANESELSEFDLQSKSYILACLHPVTEEYATTGEVIQNLSMVLKERTEKIVWILPNNDAGGKHIRDYILKNHRVQDKIFANLTREKYLLLLKYTKAMVGNSSAGLLEAPSFKIPVLNIGRRQADRVRGANVVDCEYGSESIHQGLDKVLSRDFLTSLEGVQNPYGDGNSADRILKILSSTRIDENLLIKQIAY